MQINYYSYISWPIWEELLFGLDICCSTDETGEQLQDNSSAVIWSSESSADWNHGRSLRCIFMHTWYSTRPAWRQTETCRRENIESTLPGWPSCRTSKTMHSWVQHMDNMTCPFFNSSSHIVLETYSRFISITIYFRRLSSRNHV